MQSLLTPAIIDTLTESFTTLKKIQHLRGDPSHPLATPQYLSLDEFQQLHLPTQHHPQLSGISLHTLPALYSIDNQQTGMFSLHQLLNYIEWCSSIRQQYRQQQMLYFSAVDGHCMWRLYETLVTPQIVSEHDGSTMSGIEYVTQWLVRCCQHCLLKPNNTEYMTYDHILPLYQLLRPYMLPSDMPDSQHDSGEHSEPSVIDFQSWFDLLQHCGEQLGLLDVENSQLDHEVPVKVVKIVIKEVLLSVVERLRELNIRVDGDQLDVQQEEQQQPHELQPIASESPRFFSTRPATGLSPVHEIQSLTASKLSGHVSLYNASQSLSKALVLTSGEHTQLRHSGAMNVHSPTEAPRQLLTPAQRKASIPTLILPEGF